MTGNLGQVEADWWRPVSESSLLLTEPIHGVGAGGSQRCDEHSLFLPIVGKRMMQEVARGQPNGLAAFDNGADGIVKLTLSERTYRVELTSFALIGRHRLPPARR